MIGKSMVALIMDSKSQIMEFFGQDRRTSGIAVGVLGD
jgi:hypothetical protein